MRFLTLLASGVTVAAAVTLAGCSRESADSLSPPAPAAATSVANPAQQVDWAAMESFWKRSMTLPGIDTGPAGAKKRMLIYFDPDCPVCAQQWKVLEPYLTTVRIRWVPIAYLSKSGKQRAAALLAAPDPAQALAQNESRYDERLQLGGYAVPATVPDWALRAVESNTRQAMQGGKVAGTPTLVFELYRGKRYYRMLGLLDEKAAAIAVRQLGDTMDPWTRTKELTGASAGERATTSGSVAR